MNKRYRTRVILDNHEIVVLDNNMLHAYAQDYNSYEAIEARADVENAHVSQSVDMQNMQNHMNQIQSQSVQEQPQVEYQPMTRDTMYGTMYVGPGSGYGR